MKEIISFVLVVGFKLYVENIWVLLLKYCECVEEGIRNVVVECLGKFILIDLEIFFLWFKGYLILGLLYVWSLVVMVVKFIIFDYL